MINRIFSQLRLTPGSNDTSDDLYNSLLEFDTYESFTAVQGFGYAFQDSIGSLQDSVDTPVYMIQNSLDAIGATQID